MFFWKCSSGTNQVAGMMTSFKSQSSHHLLSPCIIMAEEVNTLSIDSFNPYLYEQLEKVFEK